MIEVSDVNDLTNDPDVTVTIYRGLDRLLTELPATRSWRATRSASIRAGERS